MSDFSYFPKMVFKFRNWQIPFHRKLFEGELFFSSPLSFNDPFDCNINIAFHKLQNDRVLRDSYFKQHVNLLHPEWSDLEKKTEVIRMESEGRYNDPDWMEWQAKKTRLWAGKTLRVFCLSKTNSNILLWSHYSDSHRGFCVGYNADQLFFECFEQRVAVGDVIYNDEYPEILPNDDILSKAILPTMTKSKFWAYEEEYRLWKYNCGIDMIKVSPECITDLYLGCLMKANDQSDIISFANEIIPQLKIFKAKAKRDRFELEFNQIQ